VGDVISTGAPNACAALKIRVSSVATMTSVARDFAARSYTHWTIGLPAIGNSALPGRRVEA
jgi:hypothetical protein